MRSYNQTSCGTYIAELRKEKGYTLKALAKNMEVSVSFLSDVERGRRKPFNRATFKELMVLLCKTKEQRYKLLDLRARYTGGIPIDIEEYIIANPQIIIEIRDKIE